MNSTTSNYDYVDEYENEDCNVTNSVKFGQTFNPVFFSVVVILSVFGNLLVVIILVKYENLKSITNAFILHLAISDLLFTASLPFWVYYHVKGTWLLGEAACKSVNFVFYIGFYSSGFLLILMTIHRYIAVVNPLSDIVSTTGLYCILAPIVIWLVSIVAAIPYYIFTQVNDDNFCGYIANSDISFWGIYQQIALFTLTSLVFIFCYSQIIWRLLRPTGQRRKSKTLKVIFTLMVVFFLGWAPYNVILFLQSHPEVRNNDCETYTALEYAFNISRLLAFSHCCLNPVFYVFVGVKFKNHLMRFVKDLGHSSTKQTSSSVRSRQSRMTITSITSGEEMSL
uniref:G-protein coupled receptors family 1 profile domain-containing protein n=1 Tax=Periophthalmus magnuspinnatus TaxID=409849 RepID=A0A3B3Z788_9GOBI